MSERKLLETRVSFGYCDFDMRAKQLKTMSSGSDENDNGRGGGNGGRRGWFDLFGRSIMDSIAAAVLKI